jgi:hypothetical protein
MKMTLLLSLGLLLAFSGKSQQDTTKKEYQIKYEVLTKKGKPVVINYFDKDGKNAGATAEESWTYIFSTTDKNQNIQVSTVGGKGGYMSGKIWTKVSIYVNGSLIKSKEAKFAGLGPTIQVTLSDIK